MIEFSFPTRPNFHFIFSIDFFRGFFSLGRSEPFGSLNPSRKRGSIPSIPTIGSGLSTDSFEAERGDSSPTRGVFDSDIGRSGRILEEGETGEGGGDDVGSVETPSPKNNREMMKNFILIF
jgi:hypothetical protein